MKWLDLPPVWLGGAIALVWLETVLVSEILDFVWLRALGTGLLVLGLALIGGAALSFLRARSTIIPHQTPSALITTGLFRFSRNPIYLADALILLGLSLRWGAVSGAVLLPFFVWIITRRFILHEEARLLEKFDAQARAYFKRTRCWL